MHFCYQSFDWNLICLPSQFTFYNKIQGLLVAMAVNYVAIHKLLQLLVRIWQANEQGVLQCVWRHIGSIQMLEKPLVTIILYDIDEFMNKGFQQGQDDDSMSGRLSTFIIDENLKKFERLCFVKEESPYEKFFKEYDILSGHTKRFYSHKNYSRNCCTKNVSLKPALKKFLLTSLMTQTYSNTF